MDIIVKALVILSFVFSCVSCASMEKMRWSEKEPSLYEKGYRDGVKENVDNYISTFRGGDFPYYNWDGPIVQYTEIPAHIENGIWIPAHFEPVIIKPGEWKSKYGYSIKSTNRGDYEKKEGIIKYYDTSVADLTVLPKQPSDRPSDKIE